MTEPKRFSIEVHGQNCRTRTCAPEPMGMGIQHYEAPETRTEP